MCIVYQIQFPSEMDELSSRFLKDWSLVQRLQKTCLMTQCHGSLGIFLSA